jgi:septum formation protein
MSIRICKISNMNFPIISRDYPLILASASPRRKSLLEQVGLPFKSLSASVEESPIVSAPLAKARRLAEKKARAVYLAQKNNWILGADTVVVLEKRVLGKPEGPEEARNMLLLLSGNEHRVVTGFCILDPSGAPAHSESVMTLVRFKALSEQEVNAYVATGEPFGKAGSYAIQGIGAFMVESISGSYTNVVGLPVCPLIKALLSLGALRHFPFLPEP